MRVCNVIKPNSIKYVAVNSTHANKMKKILITFLAADAKQDKRQINKL